VNPAPEERSDETASPSIVPATATHWEISADALTYTFHLRANSRWSSGEPVTASDFLESYRRLLSPATGAPKAALFFMVKNARAFATGHVDDFSAVGFRVHDSRTLVVTLEHAFPNFLLYAASGPWIPVNPRTVAAHGKAWTRPDNFVGNGPFMLTEWRPHQRIVVMRNPHYYDARAVKLDGIQFLASDNGDAEERAFRAGQLDVTMSVPYGKLQGYTRDRPAELFRAPLAETRYLAFNTQRAPLNDARVRRALALSIDRRQLTENILRGGHEPAHRLLPPALRRDHRANAPESRLLEDAETAKQLLAEAGYPNGHGFPRLEMTTWVNSPVTEAIQQMWKKELGIEVGLSLREARVHISALESGDYDIGFITAIPDVPDPVNMLEDFVSLAPGNYPHWSDARFDELLARAKLCATSLEVDQLLRAAEDRLLHEMPLAPLYFNSRNWLMSPRVQHWQHDALWTRFYRHVELRDN
jgi:oligopeptide transport system substrate-binding protein